MKHAVVLIVDREEGEDSPQDWDWPGIIDPSYSDVEIVMTSEPLTHVHPTRVEIGNDGVWLTSYEDGRVMW